MTNIKLIIGPPGTGKTTTLTRMIKEAEKSGPVLICSLTRAAASEIASRADLHGNHTIGTMHSICYRAIGSPRMPDIKKFNDEYGYQLKNQKELDNPYLNDDDPLQLYYRLANRMKVEEMPSEVQRFLSSWEIFKKVTKTVDFVDMILRAPEKPPGEPKSIFLDEGQDCSGIELEIIKRWSKYVDTVVVAGDDDQVLFSWRGASPREFMLMSDNIEVLNQSYRLPKSVLKYAEQWITTQVRERISKKYKPTDQCGFVERLMSTYRNPYGLLNIIDKHTSNNESIMILTSCGYMLKEIIDLLKENLIPFGNQWKKDRRIWNPLSKNAGVITTLIKMSNSGVPWTWKEIFKASKKCNILTARGKYVVKERAENTSIMSFDDLNKVIEPDKLDALVNGNVDMILEMMKGDSFDLQLEYVKKHGIDVLNEKPLVTVGTVHSVKGGEADIVVLYPDLSGAGMQEMTRNPDSIMRVLYVGITRARVGLYLMAQRTRNAVAWI